MYTEQSVHDVVVIITRSFSQCIFITAAAAAAATAGKKIGLTDNKHTSAASVPYERIVSGWRLCNIKTIYACYKQWLLNGPELQTGFFYSQYPIQRSTTKCRLFYSDESFSFHSLIGNMQTLKQSVFFRKVFEKKLYSITFHAKCVISERI